MATRKYVGALAQLSADAILRAEQMMLLATEHIGEQFAIEDVEDKPEPSGWSIDEWLTAAEKATAEGRGAEWDAIMARVVGPIVDEVMNGRTEQPA